VATAVVTCWAIPQFWRYQSGVAAGLAGHAGQAAAQRDLPVADATGRDASVAGQGAGGGSQLTGQATGETGRSPARPAESRTRRQS
jgi:hypothetical protein